MGVKPDGGGQVPIREGVKERLHIDITQPYSAFYIYFSI